LRDLIILYCYCLSNFLSLLALRLFEKPEASLYFSSYIIYYGAVDCYLNITAILLSQYP
jgi:hypothetical protein